MLEKLSFGGRYIYDIFIIWQHGEEKLKEFLKIRYSYPTINYTAEYYLDRVKFLDVEVIHWKKTPDRFTYQTYRYLPILRIFILSRVSF